MAERISTIGLMTEENPFGNKSISSVGVMVEHHNHESLHTSLIGLMTEHYDEGYTGTLKFSFVGIMTEYKPSYSGSFVSQNQLPRMQQVISNFLEEVIMIAGDEKEFTYKICDSDGVTYDLTYSDVYFTLYEYGNPYDPLFEIKGEVSSPLSGIAVIPISSFNTESLSGKYVQQLRLIDANRKTHIVSQGKITIFPGT